MALSPSQYRAFAPSARRGAEHEYEYEGEGEDSDLN